MLKRSEHVPEIDRRWSWAEIDLAAIRHNVRAMRRLLKRGCRLMAVVKADAYGHGAIACARAARDAGAGSLGVATVQEAVDLRTAGIDLPVLILSEPPASTAPLLIAHGITPSVCTAAFAERYGRAAADAGTRAPYHLAVNTGMNRIGTDWGSIAEFARSACSHPSLLMQGVFTHFATAGDPDERFMRVQQRRFEQAVAALRAGGTDPGIVHAANSAAAILAPDTHYDLARCGISLYGFHPGPNTRKLIDLRPAMSVHARVTDVHAVAAGEGVGYGLAHRCSRDALVCTVPVGYADGLRAGLSGRIEFTVGGTAARQAGHICMDQCMFEAPAGTAPQIGDEVIIAGKGRAPGATVESMSAMLDTIPHEVAVGFAQRLYRVYR